MKRLFVGVFATKMLHENFNDRYKGIILGNKGTKYHGNNMKQVRKSETAMETSGNIYNRDGQNQRSLNERCARKL